jgi:hypothetical protein
MIRKTHVAAAFAFGAALAAGGAALAQTQTQVQGVSAASPAASAQPTPPPARPAPPWSPSARPWADPEAPMIKPSDTDTGQPTYAVDAPPGGASGVYLPAAILGYAKSATGCVVVGCDDGPQVNGAPASSSSPSATASTEPPPANPGAPGQR